MKYGETLRQRSIPAWSHCKPRKCLPKCHSPGFADTSRSDNIDYDDIKNFIKERTTPGKGKTVSVPGRSDDKLIEFESALFDILAEQHVRIHLFVKSKLGEIQRRLGLPLPVTSLICTCTADSRVDHSKKQLQQLTARYSLAADHRIPVARLERYGRLENDVLKAGDEIRSLARFTSTQRTAFRKLLKKYKKWTGSTHLEDRFREEVLNDPKSFTQLDLGPILDDYSTTLQRIQCLWENRTSAASVRTSPTVPTVGSATIAKLQVSIDTGSKVDFDTAIETTPLGEKGTFANYFVHPENVVELQVLLLQHSRYHSPRSRSNSLKSPVSTSPQDEFGPHSEFDYFVLTTDDPARFAEEQNALTIDDREHNPGSTPQRSKFCARWNWDEEVKIAYRSSSRNIKYGSVKKKHLRAFLDKSASVDASKYDDVTTEIRADVEKDGNAQQMYRLSSCRSRFVGSSNSHKALVMATLDTGILIRKADADDVRSTFPFAVLLVRQEGSATGELLDALNHSHLVSPRPSPPPKPHSYTPKLTHNEGRTHPWLLPRTPRRLHHLPPLQHLPPLLAPDPRARHPQTASPRPRTQRQLG